MLSLSLPIISERRGGKGGEAEPRRRDCNAIAARLKSAITLTRSEHTPPGRAHRSTRRRRSRSAGLYNGAATGGRDRQEESSGAAGGRR